MDAQTLPPEAAGVALPPIPPAAAPPPPLAEPAPPVAVAAPAPESPMTRRQGAFVLIAVFAGGAGVMMVEMLGSRVLTPHYGSGLYTWGSMIIVVLIGLAIGGYLGGHAADRRRSTDGVAALLLWSAVAALAIPWAAEPVMSALDETHMPFDWLPLLAATALLLPSTLLLGAVSPYSIRALGTGGKRVGAWAGRVYAVSTAGSILGTFSTVFILIPMARLPTLFMVTAAFLLVAAVPSIRHPRRALVPFVALALLTPIVAPLIPPPDQIRVGHEMHDLLFEGETPYHTLQVVQSLTPGPSQTRELLLDGARNSGMYVQRPATTNYPYVYYFHLAGAFTNVSNALFVGAGGFSGPKDFLALYPEASIDVVEIDAHVVAAAAKYFDAPVTDPRVDVHIDDGRRFLERTPERYDAIILDAYSRTFVPFHLMTVEFFTLLEDRLEPGGVIVSNLIAASEGPASNLLKAEVHTMQQVFPQVYSYAVEGSPGREPQNMILVATTSADRLSDAEIRDRVPVGEARELRGAVMRERIDVDTAGALLITDDYAPVEILLNPVTRESAGWEL